MSGRKFHNVNLNDKPFVITSLLYEAFLAEPGYMALLLSKKKGYETRLFKFLRLLVDVQLKAGAESIAVYDELLDKLVGVAILMPDTLSVSLMTSRWYRLKLIMTIGPTSAYQVIQYFRHLRDTIPAKNYLVVSQMGVVQSARKHGVGTFLMNEIWVHKTQISSKGVFVYSGNKKYDSYLKKLGYLPLKSFNQGRFVEQTYLKTDDF